MSAKWLPSKDITAVDVAFPAKVEALMPKYELIPDEFRTGRSKWNQFFSDMFYFGITDLKRVPKEGIDTKMALRHIKCVAGSWEPKHEHKESAVAYLMSLWFEDSSEWRRSVKA